MRSHVDKIGDIAFTCPQGPVSTLLDGGGRPQMQNKYTAVRARLELAQEYLDEIEEIDRTLSLVLDQIIETVLVLEHKRVPETGNVVPFRRARQAQ